VESFAQFLYVGFVEVTFLVQDFGYDAFRAKDWDQVFLPEIIGIHQGVAKVMIAVPEKYALEVRSPTPITSEHQHEQYLSVLDELASKDDPRLRHTSLLHALSSK